MRKSIKQIIMLAIGLYSLVSIHAQNYNYAEVLQKSMFFYECQESGELWSDNRVTWRANSALNDGSDVGIDLTGGWYDAGDHVKFNFPMAFSTTMLAWGGIDFNKGYVSSGQLKYLKRNLRWVNDYFIKCHTSPNELYGQVGNGGTDHAWWGSAEVMKMSRPAYKIDASKPGSDLAAETAAAMAASSMLFQDDDPAYAAKLVEHAKQLYNFADKYRGVYSSSITDAASYYNSYSGYNDELVWGAIWLYRATGDEAYLTKAKAYYENLGTDQSGTRSYTWGLAWDDKAYGCYALMAKLTGESKYVEDIERHLDYWSNGYNGTKIKYTSGGLAFLDTWGALRYANNTGFLALYYGENASSTAKSEAYANFALKQANYTLGDNPLSRSYVVGFGNNPPKNPHHRTAHGAWANNASGAPAQSRHTLYGALVGGPGNDDSYTDDRTNYVNNEVACDYNAGFSGVMAALVETYGGSPLSNFPVAETPENEYYTGAITNSSQDRFFEWSVQAFNHTAWPAREGGEYMFRIFVDITEGLEAGLTLDDYTVTTNNSSVVTITQLQPWDESTNIYYTQVTYVAGTEIWPGGDQYDSKEAQIRVAIPTSASGDAWDVTNDPSYDPVMNSGDRTNPPLSHGIPLYVDGELVFGQEPTGGNSIPVESVTVSPSSKTLEIGETVQLAAAVLPTDATNQKVSWSSSSTTIATVSSSGLVTAVSPGKASITVKTLNGGYTATCTITVKEIDVTGIALSDASIDLDINKTYTLTAVITPSNATDKSITWTSSDESIATVSSTGVVTGVAKGQATVTAQSSNPDVSASCTVNVSDVVVTPEYQLSVTTSGSGTVSVDPLSDTYAQGTEVTLTAIPNENYQFDGWSGDVSDTAKTITITMDADKAVTATFSPVSGCGTYTEVSLPISFNGAGEYCWKTSDDISYVNSWNMGSVEVNGTDFTNTWSSSMPSKIDGYYYIHYVGEYDWSHLEVAGGAARSVSGSTSLKSHKESKEDVASVYPNPFTSEVTIELADYENVRNVVLFDQLGRVVKNFGQNEISGNITLGQSLSNGIYYLNISTNNGSFNYILNKK